jgi:5-methyltetrahydrofolate--homocysteine methyltransferase
MLPAHKVGSEWRIDVADLDRFCAKRTCAETGRHRSAPWSDRLHARLRAGDERGSWQVVEAALASGFEPIEIYTDVVGPAMRTIGDEWAAGTATIADEHRAAAIATRIVGRVSTRFTHRGRPRGRVVIGTPPGEAHALPVSMVADMFRGAGFDVVDLGADLPIESFVAAAVGGGPVTAIAVSVTTTTVLPMAQRLIGSLRAATDTPIVVGGSAILDEDQAAGLGADAFAADGPAAVEFALSLVGR